MFEKNGVFVNGDTIAVNRKEDKYMAEAEQMYKNENMPFASLHVDVPLGFEHEKEVLKLLRWLEGLQISKCMI